MFRQLGLIGCGLMGGSFALALKNAGLVRHVVGYSPSAATLARALDMGVIDASAPSAADAASGSDLVLLAMPVAAIEPPPVKARCVISRAALCQPTLWRGAKCRAWPMPTRRCTKTAW